MTTWSRGGGPHDTGLSYVAHVTILLRVLRSLGPSGAVANAAQLLDERRHEDRVVREVARRFGSDGDRRAPAAA